VGILSHFAGVMLAGLALCFQPTAALAHPHVWVKVRSVLIFGAGGEIVGVRHAWTFDKVYSAFATQGMGKDGVPIERALQALAKVNVSQLAEHNYFTSLKAAGAYREFSSAKNQRLTLDANKILTLHFDAMLTKPVAARPVAILRVYDPTYFVAFDFVPAKPVKMAGSPEGCSLSIIRPKPLTAMQQKRLDQVQGTNESPGATFGLFLSSGAIVACP